MVEVIKIVYVTDWTIGDYNIADQDPFFNVLKLFDVDLSIRNTIPELFDEIDLLILHPMQMDGTIFETISFTLKPMR